MDHEYIKRLISELEDAAFECGEWESRYADEDYESMGNRLHNARTALVTYLKENDHERTEHQD